MANFDSILQSITKAPARFVGRCCLRAVSAYLDGYSHALSDLGLAELPLSGWGPWVESRFLISHPGWHWTDILMHVYGTDRAALDALPHLYQEFLARRTAVGVEGIMDERTRRFIVEFGQDWNEPSGCRLTEGD